MKGATYWLDYLITSGVPERTAANFIAYHQCRPEVWKAFEKFAKDLAATGRKHYGAKAIMERVRWHIEVESNGEFKICNNWTAYYARIFAALYPDLNMFQFRPIKGVTSLAA